MALTSEQSIRDQTNLDAQTISETAFIRNEKPGEDPNVLFAEEYPGKWKGYIEWQNCPEKRAKAAEILARHKFPPPPEFQSVSSYTASYSSERDTDNIKAWSNSG
jgi:sulfite oxidase